MSDRLTDDAMADLLAKAGAATPGPWTVLEMGNGEEGWVRELNQGYDGEARIADVRFIAAANPATVAALVREVQELRATQAIERPAGKPIPGTESYGGGLVPLAADFLLHPLAPPTSDQLRARVVGNDMTAQPSTDTNKETDDER